MDGVLTRPRVLWIDPGGAASIEGFARSVGERAHIQARGVQVRGADEGYGMDLEVSAVTEAAGPHPCHLAGFSAGATVVLAAALALGEAVQSVTVLEPAFIGDDDWDAVEAEWRARWRAIAALPAAERMAPFRQLLLAAGVQAPPPRNALRWDRRDELLERTMVGATGFVSSDLAAIRAPVLAIRGGRSNPRWAAVSRRLGSVCPDFREHVFPGLHHFSPPFRDEPERLAAVLLEQWSRG